MKTLYESLLDDEDEVMDRMGEDIIQNQIVDKLNQGAWYIMRYDKNKGLYLLDGCLSVRSFKNLPILLNSQDIIISKCDRFEAFDKGVISWSHQLYIKDLNELHVDSYSARDITAQNLKIDKLDIMYLNIRWIDDDWTNSLNIIHPKTLRLFGSEFIWGQKNRPIDTIKNIKVDKLILSEELFPEHKKTSNTSRFILTERNAEALDRIYKDNKFKTLQIYNFNVAVKGYEITKSPRAKFGYKLTTIKKGAL